LAKFYIQLKAVQFGLKWKKWLATPLTSVTQTEINRLQAVSEKDRFQHQWILDEKLSHCSKTGINWLVYKEGSGMFCILCRKHDVANVENRSKKFNNEPAVCLKLYDHVLKFSCHLCNDRSQLFCAALLLFV